MAHWLTDDELIELTGKRQRSKQIAWLQSSGLRHFINAAGVPIVPISSLDTPPDKRPKPNLEAVRRAG